jgi:hypothetical protein
VASLMLSMVILLVGLGFMGQRRGQYEAAREAIEESQAAALAEAGLQDALGKLAKDIGFPPLRADDQTDFTYAETVRDDGGRDFGAFQVTVITRYSLNPYRVVRIQSRGVLGNLRNPTASALKTAEVDMHPGRQPFRILFVTTNEDS